MNLCEIWRLWYSLTFLFLDRTLGTSTKGSFDNVVQEKSAPRLNV